MDSNKFSTQVERLGVVETGRRRRWTDDEKLKIVLKSMQTPQSSPNANRERSVIWMKRQSPVHSQTDAD
jgi:transposase